MWKRLLSWNDWTIEGFVLWIVLSIGFGILFRYTASSIYDWWAGRRKD